MRTYTLIYQLKIKAPNLDKVSSFAERFDEECRKKARLVSIEGEGEWRDMVYRDERFLETSEVC